MLNFESFEMIKNMMASSDVISFDVFDTLLFRKVNSPEDIFKVMEMYLHVPGLLNIRKEAQLKANERVILSHGYPHANIDEIYDAMSEMNSSLCVESIKALELQLEEDSLVANEDILELYEYACSLNKRVIAITDMYMPAEYIMRLLHKNGFGKIETVYSSADERATKWQGDLYNVVCHKENIVAEKIFHLGDNKMSDVDMPCSLGISALIYTKSDYQEDKFSDSEGTLCDNGLRKILCNNKKGFWYNFAIEAGGPMYMGLLQWFCEKNPDKDSKIYLLARDGYFLYKLLKKLGYKNAEYLYASRRALILPGITDMNEEDIALLPPYTLGQTVREVLEFLAVDVGEVTHLREAGFESFDDRIRSYDDAANFKKLYSLDKAVFLKRVLYERENAINYFKSKGVFDEDAVIFDCGWAGSSQFLFDRFLSASNINLHSKFYYFGITNTVRSRSQLIGRDYDTFLDDRCINDSVLKHEALFELLFAAPHEALLCYAEKELMFEEGTLIPGKEDIENALCDYIDMGYDYALKYRIAYSNIKSIEHLRRIIYRPSDVEIENIGNLKNIDSYQNVKGQKKCMAYITEEEYLADRNVQLLWPEGFLRRKDVPEELKIRISKDRGYKYPIDDEVIYNLEKIFDLENYCYYRKTLLKEKTCDNSLIENLKFSIIMPVYNTISDQLCVAIDSVLNQNYCNFELILVDDNSTWANVKCDLQKYENNSHVKIAYRGENGGIAACTNTGLSMATGDYIVFMDCDDIIEPDALYEFAMALEAHPEYDFIYSDQDMVTEDGLIYHSPFFKPDWSPDLFLMEMYTNHLAIYRATIVKEIGGLKSEYDGSQDYDFTLRFMEKSDNSRVGHIPKILYHWRERKESVAYMIESKPYALDSVLRLKNDLLTRRSVKGYTEYVPSAKQYRVVYEVVGKPLVSIIVYGHNAAKIDACITQISNHTDYSNIEIIRCNPDEKYIGQVIKAVEAAKGDFYIFLDSKVTVSKNNWLNILLGQAQQKDTGAVGARLIYKGTSYIRHCGISIVDGKPNRDFYRVDDSKICYYGFNVVDRNCTAVSSECLCISKKNYEAVNGFDVHLECYADVDLCMSLLESGKYNVLRNDVILYYEADSNNQSIQDANDIRLLEKKHIDCINTDSFLNCNLQSYGEYSEYKSFPKDSYRLCGYSSDDNNDVNIKARHLIIDDPYHNSTCVDVVDVPRQDIFKKYGYDYHHLWDGFIVAIEKDFLKFPIDSYTFSMQYEYENGNKAIVPAVLNDEDYETAAKRKIEDFAGKCKKIYIYGAGVYGKQCFNKFKTLGVDVTAFIVTKKNQNANSSFEVEIEEFNEIKDTPNKKDVGIVVALKPIYRSQVIPLLTDNGFDNFLTFPFDIF